jgi:DNA-binding FadR family transcriptional regulator
MTQSLTKEQLLASASGSARRDRSDKVAEKLARRILHDIVTRGLMPGTRLPSEAVMLQRYEVGRASLRESLRILEIYGLIWIKPGPGGGPVVADVSSVDFARGSTFFYHTVGATLTELVECRVFIEPLMARLAAERLTDEGAEALRHALDLEEQSLGAKATTDETSFPPHESLDWWPSLFHKVVAGMSGNRVMSLFGQSVVDIYVERIKSLSAADRRPQIHAVHKSIGTAILRGHAQAAERLMRAHFEELAGLFSVRYPGLADEIIDWR